MGITAKYSMMQCYSTLLIKSLDEKVSIGEENYGSHHESNDESNLLREIGMCVSEKDTVNKKSINVIGTV